LPDPRLALKGETAMLTVGVGETVTVAEAV